MIFPTLSRSSVSLPPGGSASVTLTVSTSNSTSPGSYSVTVAGAAATTVHTVQVGVVVKSRTIPSFTLIVFPAHLTVAQGSAATADVTVESINGFSGTVSLTVTSSSPNLSAAITPTTIAGNGTATATVVGSAPGNYTVIVTGSCCNITRPVTFSVTVTSLPPPSDFILSMAPTNQTVRRGSTATYAITVHGTNGFNGTVTLSATISPVNRHGPTLSLPSTVGPYSTSTMTVATGRNTPQATYKITVTAISGSLVHTFTVFLTVTG